MDFLVYKKITFKYPHRLQIIMDDKISVVMDITDLSTPIATATEMSKLYAEAKKWYNLLVETTHIERDEDGNVVGVNIHPDVKYWFDQMRRIAVDVTKITANVQATSVNQKIDLLNVVLSNSKALPPNVREQIAAAMLKEAEKT